LVHKVIEHAGYALCVLLIAVLMGLAFFSATGCGLIPTERESLVKQESRQSIAGATTADVVRETAVTPPEVTVETRDGTVTVRQPAAMRETTTAATTASETANAEATGTARDSVSIPAFVKIGGAAAALGLLWLVVWLWRRTSKLVDAAYAAGDELAARCIHAVRSLAMQATNPEERARLSALAGDMERDRTNWHRED